MSRSKHGKIDGQFVPVLATTLDSPAWKAMSHGAKVLFVNLKRKVPRETNRAYLSYRDAGKALSCGPNKLQEWYAELQHYGFIVLAIPGSLGVDGKGRAPHWRLTELGRQKGLDGLPEYPTREFQSWDGVLFDPKPFRLKHGSTAWDADKLKKQNPVIHVSNTPLSTSITPLLSTSVTPKPESVIHVDDIADDIGVIHVDDISSVTTTSESDLPSIDPSSETKSEEKPTLVDLDDERFTTLLATEQRRRA